MNVDHKDFLSIAYEISSYFAVLRETEYPRIQLIKNDLSYNKNESWRFSYHVSHNLMLLNHEVKINSVCACFKNINKNFKAPFNLIKGNTKKRRRLESGEHSLSMRRECGERCAIKQHIYNFLSLNSETIKYELL